MLAEPFTRIWCLIGPFRSALASTGTSSPLMHAWSRVSVELSPAWLGDHPYSSLSRNTCSVSSQCSQLSLCVTGNMKQILVPAVWTSTSFEYISRGSYVLLWRLFISLTGSFMIFSALYSFSRWTHPLQDAVLCTLSLYGPMWQYSQPMKYLEIPTFQNAPI